MSTEALVASEFVSTMLALILVYFFFKAYRLTRSIYLLGLPVGFTFLASSYIFLGISLMYESDVAVSEPFLWLRLITQSLGFAFVAFTYYFSSKTERATKYFLSLVSLASAISILLFFGASFVAPPFLELPSVNVVDEFFRIGNLVFLGYVIYHLVKYLEMSHEAISGLIWAPSAFSLLWLAQYSLFIWGIDGSQIAFVFAHVARLASLILLIRIYYMSGRAGNESRETQ
ncbi:MAG: hypothetical protein H3Z50_05280 [archaeon]|nr:hypothetical protein [archaeon]